jgi:integrase/recombinase XerD
VPGLLAPYLTAYLQIVRPRILGTAACNALWLWVSPKGGALSYDAVWSVITRHTKRALGIRVSPHDARDAAATTWAIEAPNQIGVARDLLGHRDLRTTIKHYDRANGIAASRSHAGVIAGMRGKRRRW